MNNFIKALILSVLITTPAYAAQQPVINGETMAQARVKINANDAESYAKDATQDTAIGLNTAKVSFDSTSSTRLANTSGTNTGDKTAAEVPFTPNGSIASTDIQAAIQEVRDEAGAGGMTYPGAGIPLSTGSAWGTSYTLDTDLSSVSASDDTLPSAKATKTALDLKASLINGGLLLDDLTKIKVKTTAEPTNGENLVDGTVGYGDTDDDLRVPTVESMGALLAAKVGVISGTQALSTSSIADAACATTITISESGVAAGDGVQLTFTTSPLAVLGYGYGSNKGLEVYTWATSTYVNIAVCNDSGGAIVPGAISVKYQVIK